MSEFDCGRLPKDPGGLSGEQVALPRLLDDSPGSCPVPVTDLLDYLRLEAPGGDRLTEGDLVFRRTVDFGDARYWVWSFSEPEGDTRAYAVVREDSGGTLRSYDADYYDLSPEQFAVGEYCEYW